MKDIESILYSLVPLVLIILFSWLFSFLGSKMKKPGEPEVPAEKNLTDRFLQMMKEGPEETVPLPGTGGTVQESRERGVPRNSRIGLPQLSGSPIITAKPITPKWWGA